MQRYQLRTIAGRRQRRGFTLMEVLIVLAILGVLAAMVVPRLIGTQRAANEKATAVSIKSIESALDLYAIDHQGQYPQGGSDVLQQLTQPWTDPQTGRQREPYIDSLPLDAWQRPFNYEYPNSKVPVDKPAIWSSGADGRNDEGGGDDINNWAQYQ
jgi:general secretion pathway protein G